MNNRKSPIWGLGESLEKIEAFNRRELPMNKLQEIREALEAATPGPWEVTDIGSLHITKGYRQQGDKHVAHWIAEMDLQDEGEEQQVYDDAHLIAHTPEYLSYLLQLVETQAQRAETAIKANVLLAQGNADLISKNHLLHAQVETQAKALEWYADKKNYEQELCYFDDEQHDPYYEAPEILSDEGQRAREALGTL